MSDLLKLKEAAKWSNIARPNQMEPEDYAVWLILTGRGWGKTRVGAETVCERVRTGQSKRIALVSQSVGDARDTMVDELRQNSGILAVSPPWEKVEYQPSKKRIVWQDYGAVAHIYSAEDPDALRGPQHDYAWCDELAAWPRLNLQKAWDNLMFGLRQGSSQCLITTTPRPLKLLRELMRAEQTVVTQGSTYENMSNLSLPFKDAVIKAYEGTRLGRQELLGQILDDNPDALWTFDMLDANRVDSVPDLSRVVIGVDPSGAQEGHECGIVAGGVSREDVGYCLGDYSVRGTPLEWAKAAIYAYDRHRADAIVVERNYGGDMVASTIRLVAQTQGRSIPHVEDVVATRGKVVRAEPVSGLCQQGRIKHWRAAELDLLEDQMCSLLQGDANDRVDAYVWTFTALMVEPQSYIIGL